MASHTVKLSKYWSDESEDSFEDSFDDYVRWRQQRDAAAAAGLLTGPAQHDDSSEEVHVGNALPPPASAAPPQQPRAVVAASDKGKEDSALPVATGAVPPVVAGEVAVTVPPPPRPQPYPVLPTIRVSSMKSAADGSFTAPSAKSKFLPTEMKELQQGSVACARCQSKFSIFQAPDKCGQCKAIVCTRCSFEVTEAPALLGQLSMDPSICVDCWPVLRNVLERDVHDADARARTVGATNAFFAAKPEARSTALAVSLAKRVEPGEDLAAYLDKHPCAVCDRSYDLFRPPTSCSECARDVCTSAACSKLIETLPGQPTTCRVCWPAVRDRMEKTLAQPGANRANEDAAIVELCLGEKFLNELKPAQQRVNVQQETRKALDQAEARINSNRAQPAAPAVAVAVAPATVERAASASGLTRPAPPVNPPPPVPASERDEGTEEDESTTPRMDTRAVVPEPGPATPAPTRTADQSLVSVADRSLAVDSPVAERGAAAVTPATVRAVKDVEATSTEHLRVHKELETTQRENIRAVKEVERTDAAVSPPVRVLDVEEHAPSSAAATAAAAASPGKVDETTDSLTSESDENDAASKKGAAAVAGTAAAAPLPSCRVCTQPFTIFRREKQCSECAESVCNQCVGFFRLRSLQDDKPRYICFTCLPAVRQRVVDPSFEGAELVRATREAAAVDLLLAGNLHQHFVTTDFSPTELADMKAGSLVCARSGDKFDYGRPPRRCTDCNQACTARDCRNFDWVARILQRQQPSTLCRACWPAVRAELLAKAGQDAETEARVVDEVQVGDAFFALDREKDFPEPPKVDRGVRCHSCTKKFSNFRVPQKCCHCAEIVCTGVACSGRFIVPSVSTVRPSVVCAGCIGKVKLSRPQPGQLTSQQDSPLNSHQANAITSGATCNVCSNGFTFWARPHECPVSGDVVHVTCCKVVGDKIVSRRVAAAQGGARALVAGEGAAAAAAAGEESSEPLSETDTSDVDDAKSPPPPASAAPPVVSPSTVTSARPGAEDDDTTSSTTLEDADVTITNPSSNATVNQSMSMGVTSTPGSVARVAPSGTPSDFKLTSWYPWLQQFTAPTLFVSLTVSETRALLEASEAATAERASPRSMRSMEKKLDAAIQELGGEVFIKLETRSPKDVLQSTSMMDRLRSLVKPAMRSAADASTTEQRVQLANADTIAFVKGIRQLFKVTSGKEALEMMKLSERVLADLRASADKGEESIICVRQWRDVDAAREFRAFIHNKRLTACSQYCYYQCFPELVTGRDELAARIRDFFVPAFLDASPFESVIVDLHVSDRGVEVIELSPFDNTVGACMFSWKAPADRTVLESGPFELRILEEPKANPYECLPSKWRGWFESERGFSLRTNTAKPKPPTTAPPALPVAAQPKPPVSPRDPAPKKKLFGSVGKADGKKEDAKKEDGKKKGWFGKK